MIEISFKLTTSDDAAQAAVILEFVADVLGGFVAQQDTVKPARTRRTKAQIAADAAPAVAGADKIGDFVVNADGIKIYPALAAQDVALGMASAAPAVETPAAVAAVEAPVVVETPAAPVVVDTRAEETTPASERATLESETRTACLTLGVVWLRENGPQKFGKQKLSDLSDAELLTTHTAAKASVAALAR